MRDFVHVPPAGGDPTFAMSPSNAPPIAIVGIAAELPSGSWSQSNLDYPSFYEFLLQGGEAYERIPLQRFNIHTFKGKSSGQVVTDTGAFLKNLDQFDPVEFGITSKDAKLMNLGTRKLIETTFLALLDSGIDYRGRNVGCYMSAVAHDMFSVSGHDDVEARGAFSYLPAMVANRVSYHLDLRGPTVPMDTACSSSLYATHFAVQALRNGECEAAVVGGCQLNHRFSDWLIYTQGGILSPDGKCKPFDVSANGFGRGEAAVSIVLKPLDAALRDHDKVYATILGTGINSSGSLAPVNAPVASAQQDAMVRAFKQAQRSPRDVDFIELHATGTASGDPTEANWVGVQFGRDDELIVGSVKGNLGHTEITAFLASLCKVCHIIEHGVIPPTVNLTSPNPAIRWREHKMRAPIASEKLKIRSPSGRALIAMSSSGIGGANGHCVIESWPPEAEEIPRMWSCTSSTVPSLLLACGLSPRSATAVGESLKSLPTDHDLKRVGRALGRRARSLLWKSYSVIADGKASRFSEPVLTPKTTPEIVFVFSGQGPQHWNMGRELFRTCVPFHDSVVELDEVYRDATGTSLITDLGLFADSGVPDSLGDVWPISITLPALAVLQLALVDTLAAVGVKPDIAVGHSAGETAVLYASGAASKAMALELAIARGQAMELLEPHDGTMAAVACSAERAEEIIAEVIAELGPAVLEVGCYNAPNAVTLSGATKHVTAAVQRAKATGILATRLRTKIPVHSSMMSHCQADYQDRVEKVFRKYDVGPANIKVYSALTGSLLGAPYDARYFWDNTYGPVMFDPAVKAIRVHHPQAVFVELGPHPVLSGYISAIAGQGSTSLCPLKRSKTAEVNELAPFMDFIGRLICTGYPNVDIDMLYGTAESAGENIPPYPFAKKEVPYVAPTFEITRQRQMRNGPLNYPQLRINTHTHSGLADHIIKHEPIMPAAGFLEMALEFGAKRLWDVEFHSMLSLSSERPTPVDVKLEGSRWSVCSANAADFTKRWPPIYNRIHATGYLSMDDESDAAMSLVPVDDIRARLKKWDMKSFYNHLDSFANYGPTYRRVLSCYQGLDTTGREELLIEIRGAEDDLENISEYRLHPAVLDSALHFAVHPLLTGAVDHGRYYLPSKVNTLIVHGALAEGIPKTVYAYGILVKWTPEALVYNFTLTNEIGVPLCTIEGLEVAAHGRTPLTIQNRYEIVDHTLDIHLVVPADTVGDGTRKVVVAGLLKDQDKRLRVMRYHRGREMDIQYALRSLNPSDKEVLGFVTSEGPDGDAILGFTRSLRKEYRSWKVFCVILPSSWSQEQYEEVARALCAHPLAEEEMMLDTDGSVHASRVIPSSAPKRTTSFDSEVPWVYRRSTVIQVSKPIVPNGHVLVNVTGLSSDISSYRAFVGRVDGSSKVYAGIYTGPISNHVVAHRGSLFELSDAMSFQSSADVLAAVIAVLAIGETRFKNPSRMEDSHILVTHSNTSLGHSIGRLYESRGLQVERLPSRASVSDVRAVLARQPKFVVSGRERVTGDDVDKLVHQLQQGKAFQWDDTSSGIGRVLKEDPWAVGDALKLVFSDTADHQVAFTPPADLLGDAKLMEVPSLTTIFDSEKAYILVGGIGGLGLHIAYWMYKNGAREIILTSRSGTANLIPKDEFIALRLLAYLRSLNDLVLRTEAVDASSMEQTKQLLSSIHKPIGGAMILTAILIDRTFPMQTEDTFEAPFEAKLGAFNVLQKAIDLDSLDFVLAYSSIVGLTGNAGQTNYSSANTALTGLTRKLRNAATILPPMITDTGFFLTMAATEPIRYSRYRHLSACSMTCEELCESIGETLLKLREGPVWQYIPDFDWTQVQNHFGSNPLYDHLVIRASTSDTDQASSPDLERGLGDVVCNVLDIDHQDLSPDVPLTSYGLDSLSAAALSHALEPYITISQLQLLADMTLADLEELRDGSSKVTTPDSASVKERAASVDAGLDDTTKGKVQEMLSLLQKYSSDLPPRTIEGRTDMRKTVLLTGATGTLGSHMMVHLLSDASTQKIFAIVRRDASGKSVQDRLLDVLMARGLDTTSVESHRLTVLEGDLLLPMFGLSSSDYDELLHSVTHIVHLAWPINFVAPLSALEPHIRGVRYMIDFAALADVHVKVVFASTAGMFRRLPDRKPVPEVYVDDPSVAVGLGYPESKWVAEHLVTAAGEKGIISHTIVRVGQLSGGANGAWRTSEWLPSMVSASIALGCLPDASGYVAWLPVDAAAAALVDFIDSSEKVLHLRHPLPVTWPDVFNHFASVLNLPLVPYTDWVTRLEHGLVASNDVSATRGLEHGLRLLDIFRLLIDPNEPRPDFMGKLVPHMDMTQALEASATLRDDKVTKIGLEDVRRWVDYWRREGFIPPVTVV